MKRIFPRLLGAIILLAGCSRLIHPGGETPATPAETVYYANIMACNCMKGYYLWEKEVSQELDAWQTGEDPVAKVRAVRYKDKQGNDIDRWTELMEDCSSFVSSVSGNGRTYGFDFVLYRQDNYVIPQVTFTYEDSPARNAGLQRGDVILALDGERLTLDNYAEVLTEKIYDHPSSLSLDMADGRKVNMLSVQMYSNPVNEVKILQAGDKKLGYLHFANFTEEAVHALKDAFARFKENGIEELVLDLRYNTGGYVSTAIALASMIAPREQVSAQAIFNQSVYNRNLAEFMSDEERFKEEYLDVNPGIRHLWVIVTGHSASASESLICGLLPYMDVTLVGTQTYGKFCGGYLITAKDWYESLAEEGPDLDCQKGLEATDGWGIYVIASRYADCKGVTRSMPSGIPVDREALDDPNDGYALGDPSESMLSVVLSLAGNGSLPAAAPTKGTAGREELPFRKPSDGALIY